MKTTLLALATTLALTGAALANPSLKGDITVTADIVTVGDMFDNSGDLSETAIFRAPAPGTTGLVPLAAIQNAAQLVGLADFDNVGYTRVRVVRASTTIDASALDKLIETDLETSGALAAGVTASIAFDIPNVSFSAAAVATPASLVTLRYLQGASSFGARFTIAGIDQPIDLTGTITLMASAPRLLANTAAGTILAPGDFEIVPVPLATAQAGGYADLDQLVGKQLMRQSHSGIMLKPTDVGEPTVVTRNAPVTVLFRAGAMTLTVKGLALMNASAGDPVDVLNTLTKKILHGVAQSDGTVAIDASLTVAGL
jgi:flagellar basal body P-ring formation protein FlgA